MRVLNPLQSPLARKSDPLRQPRRGSADLRSWSNRPAAWSDGRTFSRAMRQIGGCGFPRTRQGEGPAS